VNLIGFASLPGSSKPGKKRGENQCKDRSVKIRMDQPSQEWNLAKGKRVRTIVQLAASIQPQACSLLKITFTILVKTIAPQNHCALSSTLVFPPRAPSKVGLACFYRQTFETSDGNDHVIGSHAAFGAGQRKGADADMIQRTSFTITRPKLVKDLEIESMSHAL
jgi:hypothetical protein